MSGNLTHSPADVLRWLLIAKSLGTDPAGVDTDTWPIYATREPATPDSVITVYDVAGTDSGRSNPDAARIEHHGFQVRVRDPNHANGFAKARAIAVALDSCHLETVTISSSAYVVGSIRRSSDVIPIGKESGSQRSIFTINGTVTIRQTV